MVKSFPKYSKKKKIVQIKSVPQCKGVFAHRNDKIVKRGLPKLGKKEKMVYNKWNL